MSITIKMPLYACGTCAAHFTRRYNANRHNKIVHTNKSEIVTFVEYLIGRSERKYLPADPMSYRSKRKSNNVNTIVHESTNANSSHEISNISIQKNPTYKAEAAQGNKNTNYLFEYEKKNKENFYMQKLKEKIEDLGLMLHDFYPPQQVQAILFKLMGKLNATVNYASLEMELEGYRNSLVSRYLGGLYPNPYK
jgi:hypothetical protein